MSLTARTVLIVDDSPEDREMFRRYLQRDPEFTYTVLEASCGEEGLALWQLYQPDAVLLDYRLPDADGIEFLEQLRSLTPQPQLPVIVVTGQGNEAIAVQLMKAGAQDYLVKGKITPDELQVALNGAIATVQLHVQLHLQRERERLVALITQQIYQSLDLEKILQTTVDEVRQFLQADRVLICRLQAEGECAIATESVAEGWASLQSSCDGKASLSTENLEALRQGAIALTFDRSDLSTTSFQLEQFSRAQAQSALVIPLWSNSEPPKDQLITEQGSINPPSLWGMLVVHHCATDHQWQPFEVGLLTELATQVGIALRQAELYQQAQRELEVRKQAEATLRNSETRFRQLAENIDAVFWITDLPSRTISYVSPAYERLWGLDPQAVYAEHQAWIRLLHPEDREQTERVFLENAAEGKFDQEYRIVLPDGRVRWVRDRCFPVKDESGQIYRFTGIAEDITERKQAELNEAFLMRLDRHLHQLATAEEMVTETTRALGEYLQVERCSFGNVDLDQGMITIRDRWRSDQGLVSDAKTYPIQSFFSSELSQDCHVGKLVIVSDVAADPRTSPYLTQYKQIDTGAFICASCIQAGRWTAILSVDTQTPRQWRKDEGELVQETALRAWSVIERTRVLQDLREREAWLKLAQKATKSGLWDWDVGANRARVTEEYCALLGVIPVRQEITFEEWLALVHPADREMITAYHTETVRQRQQDYELEYRTLSKQGVRWLLARGQVFYDAFGNPARIFGNVQDITERKRATQEALEGKQILDALMEYMPLGLSIADAPDLHIRRVSRYGEQTTGRSREVLENSSVGHYAQTWHIYHANGITPARDEELPLIRAIRHGEVVTNEEWVLEQANGNKINILCNAGPIRDQHQAIIGGIIAWNDITNRKQAEAELRESEARFRTLADNISQLVWMADATGKIFWYNQRWFEYTGTTLEEMQSWGWDKVHHIDHLKRVVQHFRHCVETGEPWEDTFPLRGRDGTYRWFLSRAIPIRDAQGQIVRWFGSNTDIDDRIQSDLERDRLLQREQAARAEAERANRAKDEFLAILSHELRSPLNPILGWSKLLQTQKFDEVRTKEALATIERNARLQTQLINDLLDLAKILRGKLTLNTEPVNLILVIEAAIETIRTAAIAKSIIIHTDLHPVGMVTGDATRLQQIVWNLLSNAIKFTPPGGKVEIQLQQLPPTPHSLTPSPPPIAEITVTDTGKGITPEFLPHLFESFSQEDLSTTRKYGGLGLGLAIVRQLVEGHGGTISANSPGEGQGATFIVRLPLLTTDVQLPPSETTPPPADLSGLRILAVDDEADARDLLQVLLTHAGATARTTSTAAEAIALLDTFQPDLLISDIGMPNVDGYALLKQVRSLPREQGGQIPAIALTAYAGEIDEQRALAVGFQRHLAKPLEPSSLIQTILELVEKA